MNENLITKGPLSKYSTGPQEHLTTKIIMRNSQEATFAAGLYYVLGSARRGKSLLSRAIAAHAAADDNELASVACLYIFEPGAPAYPFIGDGQLRYFTNPEKFLHPDNDNLSELVQYLELTDFTAKKDGRLSLLVIDSIGQALRSFDAKARASQPAAEQGMQPADQAFTFRLNNLLADKGIIGLATLNSQLVPFANLLDGACQGMIDVNSPDSFSKHERASGRQQQTYQVGQSELNLAAQSLGYMGNIEASAYRSGFMVG